MNSVFDSELRSTIQPELDAGEPLLWAGRPNAARAAGKNWGGFIIGAIVTAFAVFWMAGAWSISRQVSRSSLPGSGFSSVFPLFGLIFVAAGVYAMLSPFLAYNSSSNSVYAVTDRRIIIIEKSAGGSKVQNYAAQDISRIERRDAGEIGDVIFARELMRGSKGRSWEKDIGFIGIADARAVEKLIRETFGT